MAMKRRDTMEEFDELALGLDLTPQPGESDTLCGDLSPEALTASFTEEMGDILRNGTGQSHALTPPSTDKWVASQRRQHASTGGDWLSHEEISFKVGDTNQMVSTVAIPTTNVGRVSRYATTVARPTPTVTPSLSRRNVMKMEPQRVAMGGIPPSELVSPVSITSTATPGRRTRRHESSSSSESDSDSASISVSGTASVSCKQGSGSKRRRGSSRQTTVDKCSDEYRRRRVRNNVAVRKSRDKAKRKQEETSRKVNDLAVENESLSRQLDSVRQELSLLRSIFSNLGVPIQQLVTDALLSTSPAAPAAASIRQSTTMAHAK